MIFFKNIGIKISNNLHQLALQEYRQVSIVSDQKSMDYNQRRPLMEKLASQSPYRDEFRSMKQTLICNLEGFRPSDQFRQAVIEELKFLQSVPGNFWIRLQRVSQGTWFPYHSDEVKTVGLLIGLDHHAEKTKFWTEINPTDFTLKARSNLRFEQEAEVGNQEVYVFNHHAVHSVHGCNPNQPRISLAIAFDELTVEQLVEICEKFLQQNQ